MSLRDFDKRLEQLAQADSDTRIRHPTNGRSRRDKLRSLIGETLAVGQTITAGRELGPSITFAPYCPSSRLVCRNAAYRAPQRPCYCRSRKLHPRNLAYGSVLEAFSRALCARRLSVGFMLGPRPELGNCELVALALVMSAPLALRHPRGHPVPTGPSCLLLHWAYLSDPQKAGSASASLLALVLLRFSYPFS